MLLRFVPALSLLITANADYNLYASSGDIDYEGPAWNVSNRGCGS